jgi:hypothetical protein
MASSALLSVILLVIFSGSRIFCSGFFLIQIVLFFCAFSIMTSNSSCIQNSLLQKFKVLELWHNLNTGVSARRPLICFAVF